jgi:hypothetical protein
MLSNFVELKPVWRSLSDAQQARQQIKVGFQPIRHRKKALKTVYGMIMYIGTELCQPLQLQAGDKIKFFIEENDSRIWQIKKAGDDVGYTLFKANSRYLKCQITWQFFDPTPSEIPLHRVPHEFFEEGLLVRLS